MVKMLRKRALRYVTGFGVSSEWINAVDKALKRIGYVTEGVDNAVVEEYARVLQLDIPPRDDVLTLLGGWPGWTFEDLLYNKNSPVADSLHEAMMALYMSYVEGGDVDKLGTADFAAYAAIELLKGGWLSENKAKEILKRVTDLVLEI
jgi:hypothetical protein